MSVAGCYLPAVQPQLTSRQSSDSFTANLSILLVSQNIFKLKYPEDLKEEKRREVEKL